MLCVFYLIGHRISYQLTMQEEIAHEKAQEPVQESARFSERLQREISDDELYLLNMITYMEAGNQSLEGQIAVTAVVLNRLENGAFGDCLWNVLFASNAFEPCQNGQFVRRNGQVITQVPESLKEQIANAVDRALSGEDPTNGAYYFYNQLYCSEEELQMRENIGGVTKIGFHIFYSQWS